MNQNTRIFAAKQNLIDIKASLARANNQYDAARNKLAVYSQDEQQRRMKEVTATRQDAWAEQQEKLQTERDALEPFATQANAHPLTWLSAEEIRKAQLIREELASKKVIFVSDALNWAKAAKDGDDKGMLYALREIKTAKPTRLEEQKLTEYHAILNTDFTPEQVKLDATEAQAILSDINQLEANSQELSKSELIERKRESSHIYSQG